jgi:hypothetical protein
MQSQSPGTEKTEEGVQGHQDHTSFTELPTKEEKAMQRER